MDAEELRIETFILTCEKKGWDCGIVVEVAAECAWSAEVRVTQRPNRRGHPDRSLVTYAVGGSRANSVTIRAIQEMEAWLRELKG